MLLLTNTTDKLQLITSAAADVDVHASFMDLSGSTVTPGRQLTAITTATTTDIVAAPGASTQRNIKTLHIRNKDSADTTDVTVIYDANGTDYELHKVTLLAGEALEYVEGMGFFTHLAPSTSFGDVLERRIDSDQTGSNVATAQQWFPTLGAIAVEASTVYGMEGLLNMTRTAGTTSHTTGLLFAGTATITHILWVTRANTGDVETTLASNQTSARVSTNTAVKAASTSATEAITLSLVGTVKINAAGTFIPQFIYSAAPGGAPTIRTGSYFQLTKKGANFSSKGVWT